jgi:hypothetical protein
MISDPNIKPLALGVITQALREAQGRHTLRALDAALWLSGCDFPLWAEAVNMPDADGLRLLTRWNGSARLGKKG